MVDIHADEREVIPFEVKRVVYREMQKRYGNFEEWMEHTEEDEQGNKKDHKWYEKYKFTKEEQNRLRQANRYENGVYVTDEHLEIGLFEKEKKDGQ